MEDLRAARPRHPLASAFAGEDELLERSQHLAVLGEALAAAAAGDGGRLVWIGGEAGVGKTTLVRRFCSAPPRPAEVLWGACDALFTPRALGPLLAVAEATGGELAELVAAGARPHEVVAALVGRLGSRTPTILVIEDVHWADEATLDVLKLLGRRVEGTRGLVLATYRDDELGRVHPLRLVLGELPAGGAIGRLKCEPLSLAGVVTLAGRRGVDVDELYRRTGGNPFFVTEALASGGEEIPATVRDAVLSRIARLAPAAREVLEAVSVVPARAELWLLEAILGEGIARLDDCVAAGMLEAGPGAVAFRHELARLAVEESLAPDRRLSLHRATLDALATQAAGVPDRARLAHHAEAAHDAEAVLRYAPAAASRAAAMGAHREAAAQYARALRFADGAADELVVVLFEGWAQECYLTGRFDEAIDGERRALALHRKLGDRRAEGDTLRRLSRLVFYDGRIQQAKDLGQQAVTLLEALPPGPELAWAYSNLSMFEEEPGAVAAWGRRAIELAERLDELEIRCHAETNVGTWEFLAGSPDGRERLERVLDRALAAGLEEAAGRAFSLLAIAALRTLSFELLDDILTRGIAYDTERELGNHRLILLAHRARLELARGRWSEALASAETALREGTEPYRVFALPVVGLVRARRGDSGVWPPLDEALGLAPAGELLRSAQLVAARAEAAWLEGRHAAVVEETDATFALALQRQAAWAAGELAVWRWRAGVREPVPAGIGEPYGAQLAGDWARTAEFWEQAGCPYEAALALADADDEGALRRALDALHELGAGPPADLVARRLRERGASRLPRGPRRATRENPANLTPRETEVLVLLAEGLRNADIAERLVLSAKTVEHHVSAILRKLDVRTRREAAAEAARLGIAPQR